MVARLCIEGRLFALRKISSIFARIDWLILALYVILVLIGWFNIYAVGYEPALHHHLLALPNNAGRQLLWIIMAVCLCFVSFSVDVRFYQSLAYFFYACTILLLLGTLVWGVGVGGHKAWLRWGGQPAELVKWTCAMAVARYAGQNQSLNSLKSQCVLWGLVLLPVAIILLQGDAGSSLIFGAFVIVFYREGVSSRLLSVGAYAMLISILTLLVPRNYLIIGTVSLTLILVIVIGRTLKKVLQLVLMALVTCGLIESFHFFVEKVLKPHQQSRIKTLVDPNIDPLGIGWNVTQSKIAIGSGGLWGKGFLQGSQTKYGFVPEQSTDFIFCSIGEEHGWIGTLLVISIFLGLISRILYIAERQDARFIRVYGYAIASLLFFHFGINIGMTIGLLPVIGIPLPFMSYGGSALLSFSLMLFCLLKFDVERKSYYLAPQSLPAY